MSTHDQQNPSMTPANLKRGKADIKKYSIDNEPLRWARAHLNLSQPYLVNVVVGSSGPTRAADKGIEHIEEALKVITAENDPRGFAMAQYGLVCMYPKRVAGNRAENLTKALASAKTALRMMADGPPILMAEMYSIIGSIYADDDFESRKSRAANEDLAIRHYLASLQRSSMDDDNDEWANRQLKVALIYVSRKNGRLRSNMKVAIKHLLEALKVFTKSTHRDDWAKAHQYLALSYNMLIASIEEQAPEEIPTLVEKCIASSTNALQVFSTANFAPIW
jgi:hypothetical protein